MWVKCRIILQNRKNMFITNGSNSVVTNCPASGSAESFIIWVKRRVILQNRKNIFRANFLIGEKKN